MLNEAPIAEKVVDQNAKCKPAWAEFFSNLTMGDVGTTWNPTITGLTNSNTATITGVYYQNAGFTDFYIKIVPATNTSSVLGSTFVNLPFAVAADVPCFVIYGSVAALGIVNSTGRQAFFPTWTNITLPVTISGRVKS